jgi:hypothetical protein
LSYFKVQGFDAFRTRLGNRQDEKSLLRSTLPRKNHRFSNGLEIALICAAQSSNSMTEVSTSRLARAILRYLHKNPDAQDTLAGIAEWWLPRQQITIQPSRVKDALVWLVARELILEVKGKDSQSHYRINDRKWPEVETMLANHLDVEQ